MLELHRQARVWTPWTLSARDSHNVVVDPGVTGWEASIDNGVTWKPSRDNDGVPGWLVAGPDFPGPDDDANGVTADFTVFRRVTNVLIRVRDMPETEITAGPQIKLEGSPNA